MWKVLNAVQLRGIKHEKKMTFEDTVGDLLGIHKEHEIVNA